MFQETVSYNVAFLAGLASFLSPCVLPLVPAYFTFITGFSLEELTVSPTQAIRKKVILSTLTYVSGFSFVFILMGASASYLGGVIYNYKEFIRITGGVIIIILGIHLTGIIRIAWLDFEKRIHIKKGKQIHLFGTFIVGMAFGAGWSPCIGPLLGSILILAGDQKTVWEGIFLLGIYSAGLAIPFILISVFINFLLFFIKKIVRVIKYINITAGIMLIAAGIFLVTDKLRILSDIF